MNFRNSENFNIALLRGQRAQPEGEIRFEIGQKMDLL